MYVYETIGQCLEMLTVESHTTEDTQSHRRRSRPDSLSAERLIKRLSLRYIVYTQWCDIADLRRLIEIDSRDRASVYICTRLGAHSQESAAIVAQLRKHVDSQIDIVIVLTVRPKILYSP